MGLWEDPGENPEEESNSEPCNEANSGMPAAKKKKKVTKCIELCICLLGAIFFFCCIFETLKIKWWKDAATVVAHVCSCGQDGMS